jgi:voltage-gated sodium channel
VEALKFLDTAPSRQNFAVNAAEAQLVNLLTEDDGSLTTSGRDLEALDEFFTIIFAVELSINAFAYWLRPFFADGWNIFDLVVVSMSLVALGPVQIPINVIRSLRAFRVIRLFGRFQGLKSIIDALASSVIPVLPSPLALCGLH